MSPCYLHLEVEIFICECIYRIYFNRSIEHRIYSLIFLHQSTLISRIIWTSFKWSFSLWHWQKCLFWPRRWPHSREDCITCFPRHKGTEREEFVTQDAKGEEKELGGRATGNTENRDKKDRTSKNYWKALVGLESGHVFMKHPNTDQYMLCGQSDKYHFTKKRK